MCTLSFVCSLPSAIDGQEIAFIVERLRLPPFDLDIDLVSLDEKTAPELLQIFASVVTAIDKQAAHCMDTTI